MAYDMSLDTAHDFLLQDLPYMPEVCLFIYALVGAARVKSGPAKNMYWAQSLVLTFLMCFGGGIVAPFLLGKPPVILINDLLVVAVLGSWLVVNRLEEPVGALLRAPVISQALAFMAEVFRANGFCRMVQVAFKEIPAGKYYPIPFWGPVLLGTIAGCAGMFLPFDKGLASIKGGSPWPLQSAFYGSLAFHLLAHDPHVRAALAPYAGDYTADAARACVVAFFAAVATLQTYAGPHFNPFSPLHRVAYAISGVKAPGANGAPAAAPATAGAPAGAAPPAPDSKKDKKNK
ncbi:hypothetical protein JKP88DRAFT_43532 [Tribonema minus]|uniref:Glycine transporter domain-containing protein n=1 Tax=Tribonema minus TaxID=303371 RepID=A0A835Z0I7_9STRA|nr:hypothetical protein JKP88DRAFT_43532 [Tribonema minus]